MTIRHGPKCTIFFNDRLGLLQNGIRWCDNKDTGPSREVDYACRVVGPLEGWIMRSHIEILGPQEGWRIMHVERVTPLKKVDYEISCQTLGP